MSEQHHGALTFRGRTPRPLRFGTSGLRGLVTEITDLEAYINTRGFIEFLRRRGEPGLDKPVAVAADLRPSSESPDRSIVRAVLRGLRDSGCTPEYLGRLPTPALTWYGLRRGQVTVMVTGSHIPFDRNGIKFNKALGEVRKEDEAGILEAVREVRRKVYGVPAEVSLFDDEGWFKSPEPEPEEVNGELAREMYLQRYVDFFGEGALEGMRVGFYQHSAVGRDLLVALLERLGVEVVPGGRSETFVPIDTEALSPETLAELQRMADQIRSQHGEVAAIVSTDGDSDRPLVAGVDAGGRVCFIPGDLLGILVAESLGAEAAAVPISANDALDQWAPAHGLEVIKTRIGSPYVIAGMERAAAAGKARVVGWEANGGFLTGSPIERAGRVLDPLPTRDAALPILSVLRLAKERGVRVSALLETLPRRFGRSGLVDAFPTEAGKALVARFGLPGGVEEAAYEADGVRVGPTGGATPEVTGPEAEALRAARDRLQEFFPATEGFGRIVRVNQLDGLRVWFDNGEVMHLRPSGNAPQMRCYVVAGSSERAQALLELGLREPDGVIRRMERALKGAG